MADVYGELKYIIATGVGWLLLLSLLLLLYTRYGGRRRR